VAALDLVPRGLTGLLDPGVALLLQVGSICI
jgi:hypothetical protein